MNPFEVGASFGRSYNQFSEQQKEQKAIDEILNRAMEQNATMDMLTPLLLKVKDPQKRNILQSQMETQQKKKTEAAKSAEMTRISQSRDPISEIMASNIFSMEDKKALLDPFGKLYFAGGLPSQREQFQGDVQDQYGTQFEGSGAQIDPGFTGTQQSPQAQQARGGVPLKPDGTPDFTRMNDAQLQQTLNSPYTKEAAKAEIDRRKADVERLERTTKVPREKFQERLIAITQGFQQARSESEQIKYILENSPENFNDRAAKVLGVDYLLSPDGSALNTLAKNKFLGDVKGIGARANQLMERNLLDAIVNVGKSKSANTVINNIDKNKEDIQAAEIKFRNEAAEKARNTWPGFVTEKEEAEVNKKLEQFSKYSTYRTINENEAVKYNLNEQKSFEPIKVVPGTKITMNVRKALLRKYAGNEEKVREQALKLGYRL